MNNDNNKLKDYSNACSRAMKNSVNFMFYSMQCAQCTHFNFPEGCALKSTNSVALNNQSSK